MDPQQELQQWFQARKALEAKYGTANLAFKATPQEIDLYNGKQLSPEAYALSYKGNGDQRFNADTGAMVDTPGYWGHPESWIQALAGAGLGLTAAGAFGNASAFGGGGGSAASAPATASGAYGPMAEGYGGATTEAAVPGALDPAVGTGTDAALSAAGPYAGGYQGLAGGALSNLSPNISSLIKALTGVGGLFAGRAFGNAGAQNAVPPQLSQLLDLSVQRANAQQPLFNAATSGLYQMLPDFAKSQGNK